MLLLIVAAVVFFKFVNLAAGIVPLLLYFSCYCLSIKCFLKRMFIICIDLWK